MDIDNLHDIVYSKNVVEFVAVANEYCQLVERVSHFSPEQLLVTVQKMLPLIYLKASLLPETDKFMDEEIEKFVTEYEYNILLQKWISILGEDDNFREVFDPEIQFGQENVTASISENLLDIYQDLKDFISSYQFGNEEVMNDALFNCIMNFRSYWGQRLVNVLRAIHMLVYSDEDSEEPVSRRDDFRKSKRKGWVDGFFNEFGGL